MNAHNLRNWYVEIRHVMPPIFVYSIESTSQEDDYERVLNRQFVRELFYLACPSLSSSSQSPVAARRHYQILLLSRALLYVM